METFRRSIVHIHTIVQINTPCMNTNLTMSLTCAFLIPFHMTKLIIDKFEEIDIKEKEITMRHYQRQLLGDYINIGSCDECDKTIERYNLRSAFATKRFSENC